MKGVKPSGGQVVKKTNCKAMNMFCFDPPGIYLLILTEFSWTFTFFYLYI